MSVSSVVHTGASGLFASSAALQTASNNVANAQTPGYARQTAVLTPQGPLDRGGLLLGQGVQASTVASAFDRFAQDQVWSRLGESGHASARAADLRAMEASLSTGSGGGIGSAVSALFASFTALQSDPASGPLRQDVLARAEDVAGALSRAASDLDAQGDEADQRIAQVVARVNTLSGEVAGLNEDIARLEARGAGAHDLRARRTAAVEELARIGPVRVSVASDGGTTVIFAGHTLVEGASARSLSTGVDPATGRTQVRIAQGGTSLNLTGALTGRGALGAALQTRDVTVPGFMAQLDALAEGIANEVNAIHSAGFGLDGVGARNLFVPPSGPAGAAAAMAVDPSVLGQPNAIAAAGSAGTVPGGNTNAIALAALASALLMNGGTDSFSGAVASLTAGLGEAANSAYALESRTAAQLSAASDLRDSISGVNLEEEAIDLLRFREAYQAAARVVSTANALLDELMSILR